MTVLPTTCRMLRGRHAAELYLTAGPQLPHRPAGEQARSLYSAICEVIRRQGARIFEERIFASADAMAAVEAERHAAVGGLDDGVPPTRIIVEPGVTGGLAGVQVHAVAADSAPVVFEQSDNGVWSGGRQLAIGQDRWLTLSTAAAACDGAPGDQARGMFGRVGQMLRAQGTGMRAVARTWLWLDDVCAWYADLNAARTAFFRQEGLIDGVSKPRLPASTGIGLGNGAGGVCAIDLIALPGREEQIRLLEAGGSQNSAFAYGSAFSRAAVAPMPAGPTLFISGTAAIDSAGRTEHVGQIGQQIASTIAHVRALLNQAGCGDAEVLSALVYCKNRQVQEMFCSQLADLNWPAIHMIAEVCRPDLLFEVEVTAGPVPV